MSYEIRKTPDQFPPIHGIEQEQPLTAHCLTVDGKPFDLYLGLETTPQTLLDIAKSLQQNFVPKGEMGRYVRNLVEQPAQAEAFFDAAIRARIHCDFDFSHLVSIFTDYLLRSGQYLDIELRCGNSPQCWGIWMKRGLCTTSSDIGTVENLEGGTLWLGGRVNKVNSNPQGIIYIANSPILHLHNSDGAVIIAPHGIEKYTHDYQHASNSLRLPSPFVFAPQQVPVHFSSRIVYTRNPGGMMFDNNFQKEEPGVKVTPQETLLDWQPNETTQKAMSLCLPATLTDLKKLIEQRLTGNQNSPPATIMELYNEIVRGIHTGRQQGKREGNWANDYF